MPQPPADPLPPPSLADAARPVVGPADWVPLAGGLTNRVWRIGAYAVKLYSPDRATPLFPNDPAAEWAAMTALAPLGLAPVPHARLSGTFGEALIYRYLDGGPGPGDLPALARLLSRIHATPAPAIRTLPTGSAAILAQTDRLIADLEPVPKPLSDLRNQIAALPPVPPCTPRLIHTDPVASNIVVTPSGPVLIDWQCPARGDPCEDLAIVLSPSMQLAYDAPLTAAAAEAFLDACPEGAPVARYRRLAPFYHVRMAAYAAWSHQTGRARAGEGMALDLAAARVALSWSEA